MEGAVLETVSAAGGDVPKKNDSGSVGAGSLGTSPGGVSEETWLSLRHLPAPEGGRAIHSSLCLDGGHCDKPIWTFAPGTQTWLF